MAGPVLESMPLEILHHICGYLLLDAVKAFSLVSRHCRLAAKDDLFRNIYIGVTSRRQLQRCVECWINRLQQLACRGHVQRIYINGTMPRVHEDSDIGDLDEASIMRPAIRELNRDSSVAGVADSRSSQDVVDENDSWRPLAEFFGFLSGLVDIHYS